jgi:hypothetical protein
MNIGKFERELMVPEDDPCDDEPLPVMPGEEEEVPV